MESPPEDTSAAGPGRPQAGSAPGAPPAPDRSRAATAFVIKLVVLTLLAGFGEAYLHQNGWGAFVQRAVAAVAGALAGLVDAEVLREGNRIVAGGHPLLVTLECTALFATGLFCAAVVAYPSRWRARAVGLVVGVAGVAILNVLRVAGLALIAHRLPRVFSFAHLVLMQWFLISCVAPLWLGWAAWSSRRSRG